MIRKLAVTATALVFIGSSVFAQSLADAKKAIDAEQYQKAKTMLKNLTVTQSNKDENFFYLGWVYIIQDYADSAKVQFNKGIAIEPKSALNYVGLGAAARLDKDQATAKLNFDKALSVTSRRDSKPYDYIGRAYLLDAKVKPEDANAAIAILEKGKTVNAKDADLLVTLGNAYLAVLKSNDAFNNYSEALTIDPKSATANVAEGVLWRMANNWESSEKQFQAALAIDPNFGPAYREWAETNYRQAQAEPKVASEKIKEAVAHYQKYMSLTDNSLESQLRYADFLYNAGDFVTLQQVTTAMTKYANSNLRVYRYIGYSALQNKDYKNGIAALTKFINQAGEKRVLPSDYLVLGRLQMGAGNDSLGIQNLRKAYQMDTTQAEVFLEIAKADYAKEKYEAAGDAYQEYFNKTHKGTLTEYFQQGRSYYFAYQNQYFSKATPKPKADSTLLTRADSAFSYIQQKATSPVAAIALYRARTNDYMDPDRNNIKGLAKPFYENYISLVTQKGIPTDDLSKKNLAEAYDYLGAYYEFHDKDEAKATENYTKAKEIVPTDEQANSYFNRKKAPAAKNK